MTELSPSAQAVLDAFGNASDGEYVDGVWVVNERTMIAAALRALAARGEAVEIRTAPGFAEIDEVIRVSDICAIADELDGAQPTNESDFNA